jgi:hypothetical protein
MEGGNAGFARHLVNSEDVAMRLMWPVRVSRTHPRHALLMQGGAESPAACVVERAGTSRL